MPLNVVLLGWAKAVALLVVCLVLWACFAGAVMLVADVAGLA